MINHPPPSLILLAFFLEFLTKNVNFFIAKFVNYGFDAIFFAPFLVFHNFR